jgi:hypothetical protein
VLALPPGVVVVAGAVVAGVVDDAELEPLDPQPAATSASTTTDAAPVT